MSIPSFASKLAFVDVETTGSSPARERVTEIGLVRVDIDGDALRVDEWSTLVNPGAPIPAEIQWLTGITNDMVRDAPPFADVAATLFDRLQDAMFVAHNARFDYGFLRAEFARAGLAFNARTLCTVRLSRQLYPDRAPHTLDALIERFSLHGEQRHRALGDAKVLWRLLQKWCDRHPPGELEAAVASVLRRPSLPSHLPPDAIDALPHAPGVYLFYGLNEHPIYIGKSVDLRTRVAGHFCAEHRAPRELRLSQEIHRLEHEETAGEFGALLRESELIKTRMPEHNVALRRKANQVILQFDERGRSVIVKAREFDLARLGTAYGPFSSRAALRQTLIALAAEHGLCLKMLGLEGRKAAIGDGAPCFNRQLHRCAGACIGDEALAAHHARVQDVVAPWLLPAWPHPAAIAFIERNPERFRESWHVFDRWCWLGTVGNFEAALALAREAPRVFEADAARLAIGAMAGRWPLEIVDLSLKRTDCPGTAVAAPVSTHGETMQNAYGFGKTVNDDFNTAVGRVTDALAREGFGILTEIDVKETMKKKLDHDVLPYRILGACNPPLARRALEAEPTIGLLLPCNVVVREDETGRVHVDFMDPGMMGQLASNADLTQVADEVRAKLQRVMDAL
jgi:DNA polymerase III subunit epsilon